MSVLPIDPDFHFAQVLQDGDVVIWPQGTGEPFGLTARLIIEPHVAGADYAEGLAAFAEMRSPDFKD